MAKEPTPKEKVERLKEFVRVIEEYDGIDRWLASEWPSLRRGPATDKLESDKRNTKERLHDQLLQGTQEIAALLKDVNVGPFYELNPQLCRGSLLRAIGVYEQMAAGKVSRADLLARRAEEEKRQRQSEAAPHGTTPWLAIVLAVLTLIGGWVASYFGAFFGERQTCISGDQKACLEWPDGYMKCNPDGLGYGECLPRKAINAPVPCPSPGATDPATTVPPP